jgi:hypothetical protein
MTRAADLETRADNIATELAAITSTKSGGKPTYSIDGQSVNHDQYVLRLWKELEQKRLAIAAAEGPWELQTEVMT